MKKTLFLILLLPLLSFGQQDYYSDTAVFLTGNELLLELRLKLSIHNENYTYGDFRDTTLITDANSEDSSEVLLIYGFNDTDGDCTTDRTRANNLFGGDTCEFNREHTFPRSLANPPMGEANNANNGIVADPHNLRPSDVQRNGNRGSKKFADGSGNSGDVGSGNWYPGDEWKGDVARIIMYMYVRYGEQCLPSLVAEGELQEGTDMLQVLLQWNVDDPVSAEEIQRNDPLEQEYGSRNPFIDNPILATNIWGGPAAEDFWGVLSINSVEATTTTLYPNPADTFVTINSTRNYNQINIYDILGKKINSYQLTSESNHSTIDVSSLQSGLYMIEIDDTVKRLIIE